MHLFIHYARQFAQFQRNARLYLISNVLSGITTGILLLLYNLYLASLGYRADFIGLVLFVVTIGAGLAIFPAGLCVDRFSGKAILIWSSVLIGVAGIGQILFTQPVPLLVSGFIAGIAGAFLLVINTPFLTTNSTPEERPHLFSLNIVLGLITIVVGKALGGALPLWFRDIAWLMSPTSFWGLLAAQPEPRTYQLSLLLAGIIAGPSFIPLFLMKNDRRGVIDHAPTGDAGTPVTANNPALPMANDVGQSWRTVIAQSVQSVRASGLPVLGKRIVRSPLFLLTLVQALIGAGAGLFISYFNLYFVQYLHATTALFGLIDGGATTITALMTLAAPLLALRLGKVNTVAVTQFLSLPMLLIIGLVPVLPLVATFYLFRQGFMDMSNGVLQVFSMEAVRRERRGFANSCYQASFQVMWALTAPLGGLIIVYLGYPPIFIGGAICYFLATAVLWGNFGRGKNIERATDQKIRRIF